MPINKPWQSAEPDALQRLQAVMGVYELADADGAVIYVGAAGGRVPFGLRTKLVQHFSDEELNPVIRERAKRYRWESNQQYTSRRVELLMQYVDETGAEYPPGNAAGSWEDRPQLGRLRRGPRAAGHRGRNTREDGA